MIKANEFRVGNLVEMLDKVITYPSGVTKKTQNGGVFEIDSIHGDNTIRLKSNDMSHPNYCDGSIGCFGLKNIEPIPLTEEWLVKFGFEKEMFSNDFSFGDFELNFVNDFFEFYYGKDNVIKIKSIHQLQNLYFALTNEELTFKEINN